MLLAALALLLVACVCLVWWKSPRDDYRIAVYDDVLTAEECHEIIEIGRPLLKKALVFGDVETSTSHSSRTNESAFVSSNGHPALKKLKNLAFNLARRHLAGSSREIKSHEDPQILRYRVGEFYGPHFDHCDEGTSSCQQDLKNWGGQKRVATVLMYLNDVDEGGETRFPSLKGNNTVRPKRGRCVVFENLDCDNKPHTKSLHEAVAPRSGEKWAVNVWLRGN